MAIDRPPRDIDGTKQTDSPETCALLARYPLLAEFMRETRYSDGSSRMLPTLTLFYEGTWLKASLHDKEEQRVAFVTADTLQGLLDALEARLESGTLEWRRSRFVTKKTDSA